MHRAMLALGLLCAACRPMQAGDAADIVRRHLARLDGLATLTLRVERQTTRKGKTHTERWTFHQKGPNCLRIDYDFPVRRLIVANEQELWEYIPAAKKAARTGLSALGPEQRTAVLRAVLARVALEGLRFTAGGAGAELRYCGLVRLDGREAHCIECSRPAAKDARLVRGWLDAERLVLLRSEFVGKGDQTLATTAAGRVFEAAPGIWFPRRLTLKHLGGRGFTQVLTFKRVTVNRPLPDALFTFRPPDGVEAVGPGGT